MGKTSRFKVGDRVHTGSPPGHWDRFGVVTAVRETPQTFMIRVLHENGESPEYGERQLTRVLHEWDQIKLWRGNRVDAEYEMDVETIIDGFFKSPEWGAWKASQTFASIDYQFRLYLTSPTGLNSVMGDADIEAISAMIRRDKRRN